jgi:hypothetical protein
VSALGHAKRNIDLLHYILREMGSGNTERWDAANRDLIQMIPLIVQFLEEQQARIIELEGGVVPADWPPVPFEIPKPSSSVTDPDFDAKFTKFVDKTIAARKAGLPDPEPDLD